MPQNKLVIVESPAKAKTISKFLGSEYKVLASFGHVRDLPKSELGVDPENNFKPKYITNSNQSTKKAVKEIKSSFSADTELFIATDEDREGEAIGWHLLKLLKIKDIQSIKRIVFHEITKNAILHSLESPRSIDENLVNAQQARRVLDRLVGYKLSPLLWRKIQTGLSAGRVQSVAVRLVVEREREIKDHPISFDFKTTANFSNSSGHEFQAVLDIKFKDEDKVVDFFESVKTSKYIIEDISKKPGQKNPSPPFITSSLQQAASSKIGYSVKRTMSIAQKLYENGHITYMRTDSVNLSKEALEGAKNAIIEQYGAEYHESRQYKTKSKSAQEAHEAIRPTNFTKTTAGSNEEEKKLYDLIYKRALASQMSSAKIEKTSVDISISDHNEKYIATGEVVVFDGFMKAYNMSDSSSDIILPKLEKGENINFINATAKQTYKKPKPRYSEASLVKTLEEKGIGRPSTYAPTISTIQDRGYVVKGEAKGQEVKAMSIMLENNNITKQEDTEYIGNENGRFVPTDIGILVNDFLVEHFSDIVDYEFTANVEDEFDKIASGKVEWDKMISSFYSTFESTVNDKMESVTRKEATKARELGIDPKTGKMVSFRIGRYGPFVQLGTSEDEDKPKFAKVPKEINTSEITLEEALELFKLPRTLGNDKEGNPIEANIGRFGPYVKVGKMFVSIKDQDPMSITLEEAIKLIDEKKETLKKSLIKEFDNSDIRIMDGRFGPYITDGKKNVKIPKDIKKPEGLDIKACEELLAKKKRKKR